MVQQISEGEKQEKKLTSPCSSTIHNRCMETGLKASGRLASSSRIKRIIFYFYPMKSSPLSPRLENTEKIFCLVSEQTERTQALSRELIVDVELLMVVSWFQSDEMNIQKSVVVSVIQPLVFNYKKKCCIGFRGNFREMFGTMVIITVF